MTQKKMKAKDKQSCCRKSAAFSAVGGIGKGHWNMSEVALGGHYSEECFTELGLQLSVAILAQALHRRCLDNVALVSRQPRTSIKRLTAASPLIFCAPPFIFICTNLCN